MPEGFGEFFAQHPVWAVILIILMALPIVGAVAWVIQRAFKKPEKDN